MPSVDTCTTSECIWAGLASLERFSSPLYRMARVGHKDPRQTLLGCAQKAKDPECCFHLKIRPGPRFSEVTAGNRQTDISSIFVVLKRTVQTIFVVPRVCQKDKNGSQQNVNPKLVPLIYPFFTTHKLRNLGGGLAFWPPPSFFWSPFLCGY